MDTNKQNRKVVREKNLLGPNGDVNANLLARESAEHITSIFFSLMDV